MATPGEAVYCTVSSDDGTSMTKTDQLMRCLAPHFRSLSSRYIPTPARPECYIVITQQLTTTRCRCARSLVTRQWDTSEDCRSFYTGDIERDYRERTSGIWRQLG